MAQFIFTLYGQWLNGRLGVRSDEAVGEHPVRSWTTADSRHVDSFKTPIHEAAESGQLDILRCFVHQVFAVLSLVVTIIIIVIIVAA